MGNGNFWGGFVVGIVAAGIFGFVLRQIQISGLVARAFTKKQVVVHETKKSPWEVFKDSIKGGCLFVLWIVIFLFLVWVFWRITGPGL